MSVGRAFALQFRQDCVGQLLAQLHAPLVKGIDVPDHALHEHLVLIQRQQRAQHLRRHAPIEQAGARPVAGKNLVGQQFFQRLTAQALLFQFSASLHLGLADHQRLGLGQAIGQQDRVMIADRVGAVRRCQEIRRHQMRALMQQLVEGMLAIVAQTTPQDRSSLDRYRLAFAVDRLAVALHVQLLQIVRQRAQIIIVDQGHLTAGTEEVDVPDAQQRQDHRQVVLQGRAAEVLVHGMRAFKQLDEVLHAQIDHDRQADRRPQRIAPANPIPELEHVGGIDAELAHPFGIGRNRDEVPRHCCLIAQFPHQPGTRGVGVGHGFLSGEGLGSNDEQGAFRVAVGQHMADMGAIDIGDEVHAQGRITIGFERLADHLRAKIGPPDTDVDHVADALAGMAAPLAPANLVGKLAHVLQHRVYLRHHILAIDEDRPVAAIAQGDMQHRAALGVVDHLAAEQARGPFRHLSLIGQLGEQAQCFVCNTMLGKIHQQVAKVPGEPSKARRISGKQVAQMQIGDRGVMGVQFLPDRQIAGNGHGRLPYQRVKRLAKPGEQEPGRAALAVASRRQARHGTLLVTIVSRLDTVESGGRSGIMLAACAQLARHSSLTVTEPSADAD